jgi:dihydrofolate reductase
MDYLYYMGKIVLYIAQSLDGFIADEHGGVDWLNRYLKPDEDYGYNEFYASIGAVVSGSKTYEQSIGFNQWFTDKESYVFTSRKLVVPNGWNPVFHQGDPRPLVQELRKKPADTWLVGGAQLITSFINANLVDELILSVIPEIIVRGIPLFQNIGQWQHLQLLQNKQYRYGVVQLHYRFNGNPH